MWNMRKQLSKNWCLGGFPVRSAMNPTGRLAGLGCAIRARLVLITSANELVARNPPLERCQLVGQGFVVQQQGVQLHKGTHHIDAHLHRPV